MTSGDEITYQLPDIASTINLATKLASISAPGDVFALYGDLGTGKTEFARAFIRSLCDPDEEVPSPTFTIIQTYNSKTGAEIWHTDLYRLEDPEEAIELGLDEAFEQAICLVEWPDRLGYYLPEKALPLTFCLAGSGPARSVSISPTTPWLDRLSALNI